MPPKTTKKTKVKKPVTKKTRRTPGVKKPVGKTQKLVTKKTIVPRKIDCHTDDSHDRKVSEEQFKQVRSLTEFVNLWAKFYTNETCLPTYYASFLGDSANTLVDMEIAHRLAKLTREKYLIICDSQQSSLADEQRQYMNMLVPGDTYTKLICEEINRHSGMVGYASKAFFSTDLKKMLEEDDKENPMKFFYVTYDTSIKNKSKTFKEGQGYTRSILGRSDTAYIIAKALGKSYLEKWSKIAWYHVNIIDTIHSNHGRCLDLLEEITKDIEPVDNTQ